MKNICIHIFSTFGNLRSKNKVLETQKAFAGPNFESKKFFCYSEYLKIQSQKHCFAFLINFT